MQQFTMEKTVKDGIHVRTKIYMFKKNSSLGCSSREKEKMSGTNFKHYRLTEIVRAKEK